MSLFFKDTSGDLFWDANQTNPFDKAIAVADNIEKTAMGIQNRFDVQKASNLAQEQDARDYAMKVAKFDADTVYRDTMMKNANEERIRNDKFRIMSRKLQNEEKLANINLGSVAQQKYNDTQLKVKEQEAINLEAGKIAADDNTIEGLKTGLQYAMETGNLKDQKVFSTAITLKEGLTNKGILDSGTVIDKSYEAAEKEMASTKPSSAKIAKDVNKILGTIPSAERNLLTKDNDIAKANILKYAHDMGVNLENQKVYGKFGQGIDIGNPYSTINASSDLANKVYKRLELNAKQLAKKEKRKDLTFLEKAKLKEARNTLNWLTKQDLDDPAVAAKLAKMYNK